MADLRPTRTVDELRASLRGYSADELGDMLATVLKEYVVETPRPLNADLGGFKPPAHLRQLSFSQLVGLLKAHLDLPELELFSIADDEVFVRLQGRDFSLSRPAAPSAPPPAETRAESPREAPAPGPAAGPAGAPGDMRPKPAAPGKVEISDRFRTLELD